MEESSATKLTQNELKNDIEYITVYIRESKTKLFEMYFDKENQSKIEKVNKKMVKHAVKDSAVGLKEKKVYNIKKEGLKFVTYVDYNGNQAIIVVGDEYDEDLAYHMCIE